jgi:cytochrome b pre-mRNA-processing protein 3
MPIASLFRRNPHREAVQELYAAIVARAREPVFFTDLGVPDTLDGRFELLALHTFLVLARLKAERAASAGFAQDLFDAMFADMDRGLREIGVGDLSVGRQVKRMAQGFYGRVAAYERGLAEGDAALDEALRRNLYGTASPTAAQRAVAARYLRDCAAALAAEPVEALLRGRAAFAPLPAGAAAEGAGDER